MNWFLIGTGIAILIVGGNAIAGRTPRLSRAVGIALALVGAILLILGVNPDILS